MALYGVDVSSHQPKDILSYIKYDFAIVKASGNPPGYAWNYRNPYMNQQLTDAWNKCGRVGVYHYTYGLDDPTKEAQFFLDTVGAWVDKAVLVIDYEGPALNKGRAWVKVFAEYLELKTGRKPVIYSSGSPISEQKLQQLGYPIWLAWYPRSKTPLHNYDMTGCKIYPGCEHVAMWQFSEHGYLDNYSGKLDVNICYEKWENLLGKKATQEDKVETVIKIDKMVDKAIEIANNDYHGYSMIDRWIRDHDCSSMMYICAKHAGYNVGVGPNATRYTGTMKRDFTRAGFKAIPFSQVGLKGLVKGDILLNEVHHTEIYIGNGKFAGAHWNWDGKQGDSSGTEINIAPSYIYGQGWDYVLRPPAESTSNKTNTVTSEVNDLQKVTNTGGDVYRLAKGTDHMWTTSKTEHDALVKKGWRDEGVAFKAPKGGVVPVYRMAKGTDHVFTTSFTEAEKIQAKGWKYEGVPFFGKEEGKPVYRLYKNVHHYTTSKNEVDTLVKKSGWKSEGVAWYV